MPNVVLDISPLGLSFYHRHARTGVSRVLEELFLGLYQHPEVRLSLAAPTNLSESIRYAEKAIPGQPLPFVNPSLEQHLAGIENTLLRPFSPQSAFSKAIRQAGFRLRNILNRERSRFDVAAFPPDPVYHSVFFPLPDEVRQAPTVHKVVTIHDMIPLLHPEWFKQSENTVRQTIASIPADGQVITVSQATKNDFCTYTGFDPGRVTPILLAASPDLFYREQDQQKIAAVRKQFDLGDQPYLLSVATLEPRKNIDHLIRCFVRLIRSGELTDGTKLVLVGTKGWLFDTILRELGRNEQIRSRVIVTGFVPDENMAALYSGALVFVYPSLYEGFGLPPLEAMQCGLPVITSNVSSLPEVVGDAAIQVDPTDADALCQAILTVVNEADLRQQMSARAVARAKLFSRNRFVQEHIELYKRIA
ncbi:glycosyl transferase group 1 [Arsenicibacter rosenii]|uniref:Glycosyl transferase group 1 n=2 Tax=Arsenicibacter rosenii TaxID=1750698 RepID=A0A1S2VR51_9BACT|nr:glycosyl transferase group 1 [Arsenicibacter rosenii]